MTYLILAATVLLFGLAYAIKPEWFLKRKYLYEEIPEVSIRTARIVGVLLIVAGLAALIYIIYTLTLQ